MRTVRLLVIAAATLLAVTACGSVPGAGNDSTAPAPASSTQAPASTSPQGEDTESAEATQPPAGSGNSDYPVIRFAAHGEGEPGTYAPSCTIGNKGHSTSELLRLTAPQDWVVRGGRGGSGATSLEYEVGEARVTIDMTTQAAQLDRLENIEFGAQVGTVELPGETVPLVEVSNRVDDQELTGYGINAVPWLTNLPRGQSREMTVVITSDDPGVPTIEQATAVLSSVRVERCAGIHAAVVSLVAVQLLAVPVIENDPLGKQHPGGEQPAYRPPGLVDLWTLEQLAYLLPLPSPGDLCAARILQDPSERASLPPTLTTLTLPLIPYSDEDKALLVELSERC